jgi:hypothetical protein
VLGQALDELRTTAAPLIALLSDEDRAAAAGGDETEPPESVAHVS